MPELAEVDYYRKQWDPGLDQRITQVIAHPQTRLYHDCPAFELVKSLAGSRLVSSQSHGKQMLFRSDRSGWLGIHLGMTGELRFVKDGKFDDRYAHLIFQVREGFLVFNDPRQFGRVRFELNEREPEWWSGLPPQILSRAFSFSYFSDHLDRRKGTQLKPVLLMQEICPGVGNWMADEILWRARLAPSRRVKTLSDYERKTLYEQLRWVCLYALRIVGDDWGDFPNSWLFNHRWKDGGYCPITEKPLTRETIGGRTTCWSPAWQS